MQLQNKVALITGGSSGIGAAIAQLFIAEGAEVHVMDVAKSNFGHSHHCDVSEWLSVKQCIDNIAQTVDRIDILINNAGIAHVGNIENTDIEDMDRLYAVNVKGVYHCSKACIPIMKKKKQGTIINIASIASTVGIADRFAYSMTKGAVLTMTYSLAKDYIDHGIRCNSISPARIHTSFVDGFIQKNYPGKEDEMFKKLSATQPLGRMGKPEEVAQLALFLCSNNAAFITGTDFPIDGGFIKLQG